MNIKRGIILCFSLLLLVSCGGGGDGGNHGHVAPTSFGQINLVSDIPGLAAVTDSTLVNPWGILIDPFDGTVWVSENGTGLASNFNTDGSFTPAPIIAIPPPVGGTGNGTPSGVVFNTSADFVVSDGVRSGPSVMLFVTEDGTIAGWNPDLNSGNAILAVDNSSSAVYKGITIAAASTGNFLYAANFFSGFIDVYDANFNLVLSFRGATVPTDFAPFNILNIGGELFVTYARQDAARHDDIAGSGSGFIDVFDTAGNLLQEFATGGVLNSPWGMALAPSGFGDFTNTLLVGNFGDGRINAFDFTTGAFIDHLRDGDGAPISINGLWGLAAGSDGFGNVLFFAAGINGENNGLYGKLIPQ